MPVILKLRSQDPPPQGHGRVQGCVDVEGCVGATCAAYEGTFLCINSAFLTLREQILPSSLHFDQRYILACENR